jgi:predicted ATP-dependent endonuclease of OLD family
MLEQIHLQNFRGFESLELTGLRRVNLIVGRNNTGKTSVLEGLHLLLKPNFQENLLRGKPPINEGWLVRDKVNTARVSARWADSPTHSTTYTVDLKIRGNIVDINWKTGNARASIVSVAPANIHDIVRAFGRAALQKDGEEQIESVLKSVDNRIRKIRVDPTVGQNRLVVDTGLNRLIPISELGQGIIRLVEILSLLIGEGSNVCIIDEIENGIHHSSLGDVWNGIAEAAERLEVQVFATTHSGECIQTAHDAFAARREYDFSVIQLFRVKGGKQGRVLHRPEVEAALAGEIDLRGE